MYIDWVGDQPELLTDIETNGQLNRKHAQSQVESVFSFYRKPCSDEPEFAPLAIFFSFCGKCRIGIKKELVQEETYLDSSWIMGFVSLIIFISHRPKKIYFTAICKNTIIHELSKYVSSCTSSFFMPIRHFPPQMLYYTRRPRDLAFGLLNFRKGFFLWRELLPIRSQPGIPGKMFLDFFGRRGFPNIY